MTAREEILARIRSQPEMDVAPASAPYRIAGSLTQMQRTDLFCERVSEYRATVVRTSAACVREAIGSATHGRRIVVSPGFRAHLRPDGVLVDNQCSHETLASVDGSLTTATLAIAETGTIVLTGGPEEGRRAMTLIPDLHVCLVESLSIVETVPRALQLLSVEAFSQRPMTFISGPSATSDIEMQRVEGVHGPRDLVVIVST